MKAIIVSDIHGNLEYVKKLDEYIKLNSVDEIVILGDILSNDRENALKVAGILNKYKDIIVAVRGNCDRVNDDMFLFDFTSDAKKIMLDNHKFVITHGHLIPMLYGYIGNDLVLQGHTHIYNLEGQYINPGSLGRPRVNDEHTFILYANDVLYLVDIDNSNTLGVKRL